MSTSENKIENKKSSDPIDQLIFEGGLRIKRLWVDKELDLIIVLLNNKKILKRPLSNFDKLSKANPEELENFENDGIGIHWPDLDEDLSLRGFIKYELSSMDLVA
ncbi:DUF2442 domain-containing protein [Marivirga sp. S37H4]|uniref:DUF2442 domain-containing protein n=1 Tax=Marivirga aurantiaca TaxID=2802615 RepID=A0A934WX08_9BACT|nr:DUF2442 domain-containing protein [Marivirga aurantiaca]MBK6264380.1 DUF2442 domain-containing protein [Marivirga aurantiaca]